MAPRTDARWRKVGQLIEKRIDELGFTKAELIRRSRVSAKTLDGYIAGKPIMRRDKERELCLALGWTADSIRRVHDGLEPIVLDDPEAYDDPALEARVSAMEREFATIKRQRSELEAKMQAAREGMERYGMAPDDIEAVMDYVEKSFPELDNGPAEDAG